MGFKKWLKKERRIWHDHFLPSLIASLSVAFVLIVYERSLSNIVLFASVGASAVLLTNSTKHHLIKLRTCIGAYFISIIVSFGVYTLMNKTGLNLPSGSFIAILIVTMLLFSFDLFHPPAISAALSFLLSGKTPFSLIYLFLTIIALLIIIRGAIYLLNDKLPIKEFYKEFRT